MTTNKKYKSGILQRRFFSLLVMTFSILIFFPALAAEDGDAYEPPKYEYVSTTYENLSKLYWAIGKMDINDAADIDNYLMINECDLYKKYRSDDFEWEKLRKDAKESIQENMSSFPTRFEIMTPLYLGIYDPEEQYFPIGEKTRIVEKKKFAFGYNYIYRTCDTHPGEADGYPANLVLLFSHPVTIERVPMVPELADLYIDETHKRFEELPKTAVGPQLIQYKRTAFLRLKVRVVQYKETVTLNNTEIRAVVFAVLDGYEIYADEKKELLLYAKDFETAKRRPAKLRKYQKALSDVPADPGATEKEESTAPVPGPEPAPETAQPQ